MCIILGEFREIIIVGIVMYITAREEQGDAVHLICISVPRTVTVMSDCGYLANTQGSLPCATDWVSE